MERERSVTVSHEHLRYLIARGSSRSADVRDLLAAGQAAVVSPMAPDTDLTPPRVRDSEALAVGPALRSCARLQGRRRCGRVSPKRDLCDHWHNLQPRVTDPCEADGDSPSPRLLFAGLLPPRTCTATGSRHSGRTRGMPSPTSPRGTTACEPAPGAPGSTAAPRISERTQVDNQVYKQRLFEQAPTLGVRWRHLSRVEPSSAREEAAPTYAHRK